MFIKSAQNGSSPGDLRKVHRALVLRELYQQPGASRSELAARVGLSSMAVGRIVRELGERALVTELDAAAPAAGRGRPATGLALDPGGAYVAGAVISAFSQQVTLLNLCGETVATRSVCLDAVDDGPRAVAAFCDHVGALIDDIGVARNRVLGAGFAVAADVDSERGDVIRGGYLGWGSFELRAAAERRLGLPVSVRNIADALLVAETFAGRARNAKAVALIHCATLLGASLSFNGAQVAGARFQAGRIGHFPSAPSALVCSCGRTNCLNCTASGWSLLCRLQLLDTSAYRAADVQRYSHLTRALVHGDIAADPQAFANSGAALAGALHLLGLAFDPDLLVLAGPLAANDAYFDGVLAGLRDVGAAPLAASLVRGTLTPGCAAGMVALAEQVFSPALDIDRLTASRAGASRPGSRT